MADFMNSPDVADERKIFDFRDENAPKLQSGSLANAFISRVFTIMALGLAITGLAAWWFADKVLIDLEHANDVGGRAIKANERSIKHKLGTTMGQIFTGHATSLRRMIHSQEFIVLGKASKHKISRSASDFDNLTITLVGRLVCMARFGTFVWSLGFLGTVGRKHENPSRETNIPIRQANLVVVGQITLLIHSIEERGRRASFLHIAIVEPVFLDQNGTKS